MREIQENTQKAGRKKRKRIFLPALLAAALYLLLGAALPFVRQPSVSEKTKKKTEQYSFYGAGEGPERARVLADNGEALEERIRLISQAEERIIMSTFEFRTDESGMDMLAALLDAAKRGVQVQLLVDGFAAFTNMTGNEYFMALSGMETAEIRIYSPVNPLLPWRLMGRMHDKYLIADDTAYILGGRNTYDYFLGDHDGYKNYDWDVLVASSGQPASLAELAEYFEGVWELSLCRPYHDDRAVLDKKKVQEAADDLAERYQNMQEEHPDWFGPCDYAEETLPCSRISLVTNPTHCYAKEPVVFYTITELMLQAEREVRFHTPYIICNDWMLERLAQICEKVPDTVMMTNSVANNGNPFGAMDYEKNKGKILDTGVKILEYEGGVSYHGKCFVIDDRLSGIGSFNWDMRSAYIDTEIMLVIDSRELNGQLRQEMAEYEKEALPVADEETYDLPEGMEPQQISFKRRARIVVLRLLAGWARFLT